MAWPHRGEHRHDLPARANRYADKTIRGIPFGIVEITIEARIAIEMWEAHREAGPKNEAGQPRSRALCSRFVGDPQRSALAVEKNAAGALRGDRDRRRCTQRVRELHDALRE